MLAMSLGVPDGDAAPRADVVELTWVCPPEVEDPILAQALSWLTDEERERQRAFVFERNRREFLATRALIRTALSRVEPAPPQSWRFVRNEYGRPALDPPRGLCFNLSNHPTLVACALRRGSLEVGVDVEPLARGSDVLEIAATVFSDRELSDLRALPAAQQPERAISLWTLKEAYIKARGMGLSLPLKEFSFVFGPGGVGIRFSPALDDRSERWSFTWFDRRGHRLALAYERCVGEPEPAVVCSDVPALLPAP